MKKLLLIISLAVLIGCEKETENRCSTCTRVVTVVSTYPYAPSTETVTDIFRESETEGNCLMPGSDYQDKIINQSNSEINALNNINPILDIDPYTLDYIEYTITTTLISVNCIEE